MTNVKNLHQKEEWYCRQPLENVWKQATTESKFSDKKYHPEAVQDSWTIRDKHSSNGKISNKENRRKLLSFNLTNPFELLIFIIFRLIMNC